MDPKHDEPKLSVNVHRRTTQLNIWMVVAILAFFAIAGIWVYRVFSDPPKSTEEMQQGARRGVRWAAALC